MTKMQTSLLAAAREGWTSFGPEQYRTAKSLQKRGMIEMFIDRLNTSRRASETHWGFYARAVSQ